MHLPKISLPKFSGNCIEYVSFWNSFCAGVHDLTSISNSVKFSYLKECLSGPALLLVKSLPLTDASYNEAIRLLKENYGQPDEINRNLHISLRKLPIVHSNHGPEILCKELSTFVDEFEIIYLQMLEQNFDTNTLSIQMEIEGKLPPPILEEILKAKEAGNWSTDKLRNVLKTILKRKLGVCAIRDQNKEIQSPMKPPKINKFFTPTQSQSDSYSPQNQSHLQSSSLSFATQRREQNKISRPTISPKLPCLFCEDAGHFSSNCSLKRCFRCLKPNHFAKNCPSPSECSQCHGNHPRPLCPTNLKKGNQQTNNIQSTSAPNKYSPINTNQISPLFPNSNTPPSYFPYQNFPPYLGFNPYFYHNMYTSSPIPPQNLSIKPTHSPQEKVINNNTMTNFCVQNTPFEPNPAITDKIRVNKHVDNIVRTNHIMEAQNHPTLFRGGGRSERYLKLPPNNKKFKILLKANRPHHPQSTDPNMDCDQTPTIGIATTESSAPPSTETTSTRPQLPSLASFKLPSLASFKPPSLASFKLPQSYNIAARVRILETGTIESGTIHEQTIKKNSVRKGKRKRNKKIHKKHTISKPTPLNKIYINPNYIQTLLTPPPPPNVSHNLITNRAPSIRSLWVPILTPATPLLPFQFITVQPIVGPGVSRFSTRVYN
uniref:CCHC-type domain-containing protein n=1 Tax=Meloidogyne enterolobii TaxID=390850 RepID=A0A6V7XHT8_MELEN|nr:unnamed protein product [Meloidogyne enterolobii]